MFHATDTNTCHVHASSTQRYDSRYDTSYDSEYDAGYDSEFDAGYDVGYDANALNVKSNTFEGIEERCLFKWCHRRCGPARIGQKSRTRLRGAHG